MIHNDKSFRQYLQVSRRRSIPEAVKEKTGGTIIARQYTHLAWRLANSRFPDHTVELVYPFNYRAYDAAVLELTELSEIHSFGDVTPCEYGGGIAYFESPDRFIIEYTYGLEEDGGELCTVYQFAIADKSVIGEMSNCAGELKDWIDIASSAGADLTEIRRMLTSTLPGDWLELIRLYAGHYGWSDLDAHPVQLDPEALTARWKNL